MRRDLPSGTVTFLFTDVEGSTKLLHELGAEEYARALAEHRRILRDAFAAHGGVEVDTQGDAFFVAFPTAPGALAAAAEATEGLATGPIRMRIGLHTGTPHLAEEGYVGSDVHKGARIAAAGHGGQVLLSKETRELAGVEVDVADLGEHRLKDFAEPVWIFQLGAGRFQPLKTISNTNLPRPASSFVGREREVSEIGALLRDGTRLVTLTGPGGSGKSRLAIEAAAELVPEFRNGVFWIGLAPLRDPTLVMETVARAVGATDGLAEHVAERELLLLLDNFEQVVEAAPELPALLESCPNLRVLITSRELLRVRGEVEYAVPTLAEREAVELFSARSDLAPDETIAELCRRLDTLPLAVELAAARTSVLSPAQILERLSHRLDLFKGGRDADPRQQTLRATIAWSYELLGQEERRLFARLAVFVGGCTLEAAQELAEADLDPLQSLVDKSLLRHTDERFWMLETIREYAAERLEESGEADRLRRKHAEHFLALAEEAAPNLRGASASPGPWLDRLEAEHDNVRAAFDRLQVIGETQRVLRLAGALWVFWNVRGHLREARRRLDRALDGNERPTAARARALVGAAAVSAASGDSATATMRAEAALTLHRSLGDRWGAALSQSYIATAAAQERDWAKAQPIAEKCARAFEELGDEHYAMLAKWLLAWMCRELGDRERARALAEENVGRARALGDERVEARSLGSLAMLAVDEGRLEDAVATLKEANRIHRALGDRFEIALDLCRFARALAAAGRPGTAARILATGEALREQIGATLESWIAMEAKLGETLTAARAQLGAAAFAEAWEQGRSLTADEAVELALDALDSARPRNPATPDPPAESRSRGV
ncbi:MAG: adenylate/guanylate cyclase domain-containing protein [Gaiellaceae bacterium]